MSEHALGVSPTIESLTRFLKEDDAVAQSLRVAATAAGVERASDDLLIVEEEDVARLLYLGLNLATLRVACERLEAVVARLLAQWRADSESAFTPQELLWALTYVLAAEGGKPADRIRGLVSTERWWQRATDSHRNRFLERILAELTVATDGQPTETR